MIYSSKYYEYTSIAHQYGGMVKFSLRLRKYIIRMKLQRKIRLNEFESVKLSLPFPHQQLTDKFIM